MVIGLSDKAEGIKTITTVDAAKCIGVDEIFIIDKIKEGKIIAIEAGNEITTKYYVFNESFQKYIKETAEKIADELKEREMAVAASAGKKLICFYCDDFKSIQRPPPMTSSNEIWMSWRDALSDYSIEKLIEMSAAHFKIDLSFLKKYSIESEHFTYKISNIVKSFEFNKHTCSDDTFYYISMIEFKKQGEETTPVTTETSKPSSPVEEKKSDTSPVTNPVTDPYGNPYNFYD